MVKVWLDNPTWYVGYLGNSHSHIRQKRWEGMITVERTIGTSITGDKSIGRKKNEFNSIEKNMLEYWICTTFQVSAVRPQGADMNPVVLKRCTI